MLSQKGWQEGEGLGAWRMRNSTTAVSEPMASEETEVVELGPETLGAGPSTESMPSLSRGVEVIDLTNDDDSDSDDENEVDFLSLQPKLEISEEAHSHPLIPNPSYGSSGTVLLQPIATYLKPDKLGIGASFRPSTFRTQSKNPTSSRSQSQTKPQPPAPKKQPFTDTAQAMYDRRDRIRRAREAEHRASMSRLKGGKKGSKGFALVKKEEERRRQDLLAYMHS